LAAHYAQGLTELSGLEATVLGALGARDANGDAVAAPLEMANPLAALSVARLAAPVGAAMLPPDFTSLLGRHASSEAAPHEERLSGVESELAALKKTVASQARTIRSMRAQGSKP
jgi:hypothetical protein